MSEVDIEIRAAEIRSKRDLRLWGEVDGWVMATGDQYPGAKTVRKTPHTNAEWAGWLAGIIARHRP